MPEEKTANVREIIELCCDEFCDKYCKYPEIYCKNYRTPENEDGVTEKLWTEVCNKCPINRLM